MSWRDCRGWRTVQFVAGAIRMAPTLRRMAPSLRAHVGTEWAGTAWARMFHLARFPIVSWCVGSRYWNRRELARCSCACVGRPKFWPTAGDTVQTFLRRTARWSDRVMHEATVPRWDAALLSNWWKWAGHAAGLAAREPTNGLRKRWRGATPRTEKQSVPSTGGRATSSDSVLAATFAARQAAVGTTQSRLCVQKHSHLSHSSRLRRTTCSGREAWGHFGRRGSVVPARLPGRSVIGNSL